MDMLEKYMEDRKLILEKIYKLKERNRYNFPLCCKDKYLRLRDKLHNLELDFNNYLATDEGKELFCTNGTL